MTLAFDLGLVFEGLIFSEWAVSRAPQCETPCLSPNGKPQKRDRKQITLGKKMDTHVGFCCKQLLQHGVLPT